MSPPIATGTGGGGRRAALPGAVPSLPLPAEAAAQPSAAEETEEGEGVGGEGEEVSEAAPAPRTRRDGVVELVGNRCVLGACWPAVAFWLGGQVGWF